MSAKDDTLNDDTLSANMNYLLFYKETFSRACSRLERMFDLSSATSVVAH